MRLNFQVLTYFLAIANEESITAASEVLHVTQPTVSRQISDLEKDLGVILFERGKNGGISEASSKSFL